MDELIGRAFLILAEHRVEGWFAALRLMEREPGIIDSRGSPRLPSRPLMLLKNGRFGDGRNDMARRISSCLMAAQLTMLRRQCYQCHSRIPIRSLNTAEAT